mmetsp:Transcript_7202/g.29863  ORF Transcript_7202/g.29863 Transcript_7202/m.29863 type:complete len:367 (-) Transcript_7202:1813-2913(-)
MQSCANGSPGRGHSRSSAMIRRARAPVDASNAPRRIVESCARHRVARGGTAACGELRHRAIRGTTPSRIKRLCLDKPRGDASPAASASSAASSCSSPAFPPTPFSPDIFRSMARSRPSANTTRISKLGGTSSADPASAAMPVAAGPPSPASEVSSSPYFAFLYRSPAAGPASSSTNRSEPGAGSLIRNHPFSQTRFPVSFCPRLASPSFVSSSFIELSVAATRSSRVTPSLITEYTSTSVASGDNRGFRSTPFATACAYASIFTRSEGSDAACSRFVTGASSFGSASGMDADAANRVKHSCARDRRASLYAPRIAATSSRSCAARPKTSASKTGMISSSASSTSSGSVSGFTSSACSVLIVASRME